MDNNDMLKLLADVRDEYEREMRRGVLQHDIAKAHDALTGVESVERIEQRVRMRIEQERQRAPAPQAQPFKLPTPPPQRRPSVVRKVKTSG